MDRDVPLGIIYSSYMQNFKDYHSDFMLLGGLNVCCSTCLSIPLWLWQTGAVFLLPQWWSPNLKVGLPVWWSNTGKTPWGTFQGLPHLRLLLVYFQVVQLPKETYATDIHWFPPGVSSKKTSNQSDLFVLACTDGQSAVVRVMWLAWELMWLVW